MLQGCQWGAGCPLAKFFIILERHCFRPHTTVVGSWGAPYSSHMAQLEAFVDILLAFTWSSVAWGVEGACLMTYGWCLDWHTMNLST